MDQKASYAKRHSDRHQRQYPELAHAERGPKLDPVLNRVLAIRCFARTAKPEPYEWGRDAGQGTERHHRRAPAASFDESADELGNPETGNPRTGQRNAHGAGRCTRQPGALRPDAGSAQRHHGGQTAHRRYNLRRAARGQACPELVEGAFDADWLRLEFNARGTLSVIPPRKNRKQLIQIDTEMYKWRHLVENYFAKITEFRGIATRYGKTDESFRANLNLAATIIACR